MNKLKLKHMLSADDYTIVEEYVKSVNFNFAGERTTICLLVLKNTYEVVGWSSTGKKVRVEDIGKEIALQNAVRELRKLVAFQNCSK